MTTWSAVHVGDRVRGADQRGWTVVERGRPRRFVTGGEEARFSLRFDTRIVSIWRTLADPVDLMERADHTETQGAASALIGAGITVEILGESMQPDPFAPPNAPSAPVEPKYDRWNRYLLPDPVTGEERAWTRVSTIARTLADEFKLTLWKMRMVAKGIALRPDLHAGAAAADPEEDKSDLNSIAKQAMDAAEASRGANLGTAMHTFARRLDAGESAATLRCPAPLDADLSAYHSLMRTAGLRIEQSERVVLLPALGIAGRFDRIVRQSSGDAKAAPLATLDLKTGKDLSHSWLEIAIQQALYAHAEAMWVPATNSYEPMPTGVDQHRGLVLHLPIGKAAPRLYAVDLTKGWAAVELALQVRAARGDAKNMAWLVTPQDPMAVALHNVSRAANQQELAELWETLNKRGLWTQEVNAAAALRWEQIQQPQPVM